MANRVKEVVKQWLDSKTTEEIMAVSTPFDKTSLELFEENIKTIKTIKTDTSEDVYTSYSHRGQGHKGRTYKIEQQQLRSSPRSYVYRSKVIKERAFFIENPEHRNIVHYFDSWASSVRKKIPEHLCMARPIFAKPNQDTKDGDKHEEIQEIVDLWEDLRLQEIWQKSVEKSFIHGTCLYYPLKLTKYEKKWYSGLPAYVVANDEFIASEFKYGHPIKWEVTPSNPELDPYYPNVTNAVFYDYSNSDDFDGVPYLISSWDDIISLIFIKDAVYSFDQRHGNGFMVLAVPNNTSDPDMLVYENTIKNLRTSRGIVVRTDVEAPVQVDWMGMGGAQIDFMSHIEKIEDLIAKDIGFPKRWLLGDPEGAMESSGKDALQINIKLKALFKPWVNWMKRIFMFYGLIDDYKDVDIITPFEMQISEQEKLEMQIMKTNNIASKAWLSIDEKRELDGYPPLTDEQKQDLESYDNDNNDTDGKSNNDGDTDGKETEKKEMKSDSLSNATDLFKSDSLTKIGKLLGISTNTVSRIRANIEQINTPSLKNDSIAIESNTKDLGDGNFLIEDVALVIPQRKKYDNYHYTRTNESIERIFNDEAYPKEFRIGVAPIDVHPSIVKGEITSDHAIGSVKFKRLDENGVIRGDIIYNMEKTDQILGQKNWIREYTEENKPIPTSVALYSKNKPTDDGFEEFDLDVRSFIFTKNPRNKKAGL